jgi:hypothetical protein
VRGVNLITPEYASLLRQCHEDPRWGTSAHMWTDKVRDLARIYGPTILDYGCGKGVLRESLFNVTNYDPATFPDRPEPHDLVVCLDVLEHVEFELLPNVLDDLRKLTKQALFVVIATQPAKKVLPDGRNAHLIVENGDWWRDQLLQGFDLRDWDEEELGVVAVLLPKVGE